MIKEAFCAGTLGALLWLDRYQIGQIMISRPIVVGPIIGVALGDIPLGLAVGVLFEVLWLRRPPIGGFIAPDVTFSTAIASAVAIIVEPILLGHTRLGAPEFHAFHAPVFCGEQTRSAAEDGPR